MRFLLYGGILVCMFFSNGVAAYLGLKTGEAAYLPLLLLPLFKVLFIDKRFAISTFEPELRILALGLIVCLLKLIAGDYLSGRTAAFFMLWPMLASVLLLNQDIRTLRTIKYLILLFFIAECTLAIYEKVTGVNIFPIVNDPLDPENTEEAFRSYSFLGNPLTNALVVSIIMGFTLISDMRLPVKGFFITLGIVAILCFNARGATMVWLLLTGIFLFSVIRNSKVSKLTVCMMLVFAGVAIYGLYDLIVLQGFGDRLVSNDIYDGSAKTRVDVFAAFSYITTPDLLLGNLENYLLIMNKLGGGGVENSYIVLIIFYGVPVFALMLVAYFSWLKQYLKNLQVLQKVIILLSFVLVGSLNNALSEVIPWLFFIFCINAFVPEQSSRLFSCDKQPDPDQPNARHITSLANQPQLV